MYQVLLGFHFFFNIQMERIYIYVTYKMKQLTMTMEGINQEKADQL